MSTNDLTDKFRVFMERVGSIIGVETLVPGEENLISLSIDNSDLHIQYIETTGKLLVFTRVSTLSKGSSAEVYKTLLAANLFAQETGGGWFGLEGESEQVVYHCLIDFTPLAPEPEEFVSLLEKIVELSDYWKGKLVDVNGPQESLSASDLLGYEMATFIQP